MTDLPMMRWYTEDEVANRYGVSIFTVKRWRKAGSLRAKRLGRGFKVREDWLLAWEETGGDMKCGADETVSSASSGSRSVAAARAGTSRGSIATRDRLDDRRRALTILQKQNGN
jgi:excisionase family DNA binding protein